MNNLSNILPGNIHHALIASVPKRQILDKSLHLTAPKKPFNGWSLQDHNASYQLMQRISQSWKNSNLTDQYLVFGKIDSKPFHWELIPYKKCRNRISRAVQQLIVLWRIVFGGTSVSQKSCDSQLESYKVLLQDSKIDTPVNAQNKSNDAFCKNDTIHRQWVMTGEKVNVLFNYAPIGFGGEKLHFLVVPKQHRETFNDVTQEEYGEALGLTSKLVNHITDSRKTVKNVYLLNKTGVDAGQTVKHWHLHVIFSTNAAQDFWGKLTVIKKILFGSSPMKKDELAKKVGRLREELAGLA